MALDLLRCQMPPPANPGDRPETEEFTVSIASGLISTILTCALLSAIAWKAGRPAVVYGLLLGHLGSALYFILLYCQVFSWMDIPIEQLQLEGEKYAAQGFAARFYLIIGITLIGIYIPCVSPLGLVIGLVVPFRIYVFCKMVCFVWRNPNLLYQKTRR